MQAAAGEREKGASDQAYYEYLAKQNEVEANVTEKRADQTVTGIQDQALQDELGRARDVRKLEGVQKSTLASRGIYGDSKTAQDISLDTLSQSEKDAAALRYNADVKSYETKLSSSDRARALRGQASSFRISGANAMRAGGINAQSSLIGTATNVADRWSSWNRTSKGA